MARVFLSYRRDDSAGFAGRLADALEARFGADRVFRDVDDIRPGEDFAQAIQTQLEDVGAVLVLIGPRWLTMSVDGRRRLDDPEDYVRREIQTALASGKPVIPVLVSGATMPVSAELPEAIADLARRQAVVLSDTGWRADVARLTDSLAAIVSDGAAPTPGLRPMVLGLAGSLLGMAAFAWWLLVWRTPQTAPPVAEPAQIPSLAQVQPVPAEETPRASSQAVTPEAKSNRARPPAISIDGRWQARVTYDWGVTQEESFDFTVKDGRIRGVAGYLLLPRDIRDGRLEGDRLEFVTHTEELLGDEPPRQVTHRYVGRTRGNAIQFTLYSGGGFTPHAPVEFMARREGR